MSLFPRLSAAACLILLPVAVAAAPDRGDRLEDFDRTVTEKPFEITVDQRACAPEGVHVQVLGSGGPGLDDGSASSGYLVWVDGRARVLIDTGPGTALNFEQSGADFKDLVAVAYTHLHPDHSSDLPAFVQGSEDVGRTEDLPLYGPAGNDLVPGLNDWIDRIIGPNGSWPLLSDYLSSLSSGGYKLIPYQMNASGRGSANAYRRDGISLTAIPTDHGRVPALAWRVDVEGVGITFTGDTANRRQTVAGLAEGSAILVAHHAVPESVRGADRERHMPPSQIGRIAEQADVNMVILSHRTARTRGRESRSRDIIRKSFRGGLVFANDLECWET